MESSEENAASSSSDLEVVDGLKAHLNRIVSPFLPLLSTERIAALIDRAVDQNEASKESLFRFALTAEQSLLVVEISESEIALSLEVKTFVSKFVANLVLIKTKDLPLDGSRPLFSQVQIASVLTEGKDEESSDAKSAVYLQNLQQFTRHFIAPIARTIRQNTHTMEAINEEDDLSFILQKKVRELDFALEQCQRGSSIPSIALPIPPSLTEIAKAVTAEQLRTYLERYNAAQVDVFFSNIQLTMGETEEKKEEFANAVNKTAKLWPAEIIRQTRLTESPFAGTVEKEINFWKDLDRKLAETKEQMESAPILLTKLVLKRTNRVSEQLIHEAESVLDRALKTVGVSLTFLRDFPIDELQSANNLTPKLSRCVTNCLTHFSKLKHSQYDYGRAMRLLEVLGSVVFSKMISILEEKKIMHCPLPDWQVLKGQCDEVFLAWSTNLNTQRTTMRDVAKRRNENFTTLKFDLDGLQKRIEEVFRFRSEHDHLLTVFTTALANSDGSFLSELSEAYQIFVKTNADLFDISPAGQAAWISSREQYNRRLEKLDERITHILEERLGEAKSADEMFRIFSVFNPLFYRPAIRSAVNSFRATLMKSVREDVKKLQDKFRLRYDDSYERVMADLRDIPPLSGRIIWARQIENQLSTLMERIQNVLGQDWEDHAEGKQLKDVCDALRGYLGTQQIYEDWISVQIKSDVSKYSKVKDLLILVETDQRTLMKVLKVNFDEKQITTYKEVQYLEWLLPKMSVAQKTIPTTIKSRAKEAFARYPTALALDAALVSYNSAKGKINDRNLPLLIKQIEEVRELFNEAVGGAKRAKWIRWDSPPNTLNDWVNHLVNKITHLQERVDDVTNRLSMIEKHLADLSTCEYNRAVFEELLLAIQAIVDELPSKGLTNVQPWVQQLDNRLEEVLKERLKTAILIWSAAFARDFQVATDVPSAIGSALPSAKDVRSFFKSTPIPTPQAASTRDRANFEQLDEMLGDLDIRTVDEHPLPVIVLTPSYHELSVSNQLIYVQPTLETTMRYWIREYHEFIAVICTLPRIAAGRFQVFAEASKAKADYSDLLERLDSDILLLPYSTVTKKVNAARAHILDWLQYQALWDASISTIAEHLGKNLDYWRQFLTDIKTARAAIDVEDDERAFGPIIINHRQAQNKINLKYDTWQRDAQSRFGAILLEEIKTIHGELIGTKSRLESISFEGTTKDAIIGVHLITKVKDSVVELDENISNLKVSEKLLQSQRFNFPVDWLPVSNILGVYTDLCDILERRTAAMNAQLPALQQKIREEDASIQSRIETFLESWNLSKPVEGNVVVTAALEALSMFSVQREKIHEDAKRLRAAKESLRLDFIPDDRLSFVEQEIADLREAWTAIAPITEKLQAVSATPMKDLNPPKIRKSLEDLIAEVKQVPAKLRGYAAVETILEKLQKYLGLQSLLRDLSTDALKDRHWKVLLDKMGLSATWKTLTVGVIWESNALVHRKYISEVLSTAQGELALEQFLHDLRDHWVAREITISARDGAKIVTAWEGLFSTLEDNLNALASLKQSPYFRNVPEFQEDAVSWESRLTNLRSIFDIWVEVQRKWLYLRGIFKNNDIKAQLPAQFTKFKSIDNEYSSLMKRMSSKPVALEVLQIENLCRQLEREDSTMALIQKALGEYLESQRQIFPRFYFVNNDDLVEIIGNSNEPAKIMMHLGKMFAAVAGLKTNLGSETEFKEMFATAMLSKEGESVDLSSAISLNTGVKEWLGDLHTQMSVTLNILIDKALAELLEGDVEELLPWINRFPAQICILAMQLAWTRACEEALRNDRTAAPAKLQASLSALDARLQALSLSVLQNMEAELRQKTEQLLTEMVHQRDVLRSLIGKGISSISDFGWLYHLRFYWDPKETVLMNRLLIKMSNACFHYGFEYLGIGERLVQTPLTDRCYLTLTQALHFRMGGNPFGPAGTGKTESVKMLGSQLGRFVLVFNCDSSFDYAAMGRIFSGLCQVGAWGCFDEFNRLEERILSAVSQQILSIQRGLLTNQNQIDLMGLSCKLSRDVGIFVTLNPGYAGRSNLPDNLKQLFRAVAMSIPDRKLIAQVMLFSQGIATAEDLAGKIVLLFVLCEEQLSDQSHYDFGLRALKSVLVGAGELKRQALSRASDNTTFDNIEDLMELEKGVLLKSTCDSILPKLVAEDIPLFISLLQAVFPGASLPAMGNEVLIQAVRQICSEECLEVGDEWLQKIIQLKQIQDIRHGIMMVGPSGSGKTSAWRILLKALCKVDGVKGDAYVIDPKSIKKEKLFGSLDPNTLEWTDGVFTKILRKLADPSALRGVRRSWIIFDGDVDPEWAENLNSVLDDNKVLTLPSGDRLKIPPNVRIMMEVDNLKHATLATVSRCGMVWFAGSTVSMDMAFRNLLTKLAKEELRSNDGSLYIGDLLAVQNEMRKKFIESITAFFLQAPALVETALHHALQASHVMECKAGRLLETLCSMLMRGIALCLEYNESNSDFPLSDDHLTNFATKWLLFSLLWSFGSSLSTTSRLELASLIHEHMSISFPTSKLSLLDVYPNIQDGEWIEWSTFVPRMEIESHKVSSTDVVITTTDTVRHVEVLKAWLMSRKHLILCGPPGSGKTMTLTSVLESMPEYILAPLSFSSGTNPEIILKTFAQYCEIVDSPDGLTLQPNRQSYRDSQWLVIFCDEINLPAQDSYGTQKVISFLRQLTEHGGFWNNDCKWVHLRRVQFVGACNPPTDAGRVELSSRFLRHAPVLFVDYPVESSLKQIYRCFNQALLRMHPNLKGFVDPLNDAMVEFYVKNKDRFSPDQAPQYIYSPRELSRWVRAMYEAMEPLDAMSPEELVRLWGHEALRLFQDRLIDFADKTWCADLVDLTAARHFPGVDVPAALKQPILFSQWLKKTYQSTERDVLREFVGARLRVFYEEELDVPLVIFDEVLDHVLRIDNVLRHPVGHLLLVGESGVGKTVLTRFVAWMNGLNVFQIKANSRYTIDQFDEDLRTLFRRVGVDGEKICFIFDESNALSSAFLERMNALLASGEVPGLFEGEDRVQLLAACRDSFNQREGLVMDSEDELFRRFTRVIQRNLHVVFTMNPLSADFSNRCTTSPALFNRCVVDWFGTWSKDALIQVARDFTKQLDTGYTRYMVPSRPAEILSVVADVIKAQDITLSEAVVAALVSMHDSAKSVAMRVGKTSGKQHYLSPRDFLDFINKFIHTEREMKNGLEDQQTHVRAGLQKLLETQDQVAELNKELLAKNERLRVKDSEANIKLTQMVEKQNEAEQRKAIAEKLTAELKCQNEEIRVRKEAVEKELSEAEPALISAKQSVSNIRKNQLDEVRALAHPPNAVRLTMEMVAVMIGETNTEWNEIRKIIRRDDFITTVVNFDPLSLTPKQMKIVNDNYLSNTELDYNSVDRASKACGPLYKWAGSQIKYASILKKIKPLRDEMLTLQEQSKEMAVRQQDAVAEVSHLEDAIKTYKIEYAAAIRETEIIRTEMDSVSRRVSRANALLASLQEEKTRWESTAQSFDLQMSSLIGDCLLSAAFLTYAGIFDHKIRRRLMTDWTESMESLGVPFRADLDMVAYLSRPSDQLKWLEHGLPNDSLAIQNAILLERFHRFPLVIDPSGQALRFLLSKFSSQRIVKTSFLDAAFLKTLVTAIRFGNPLLVEDVENLDPILNPVLNREVQRTGGRTVIRLGNEDIDFSPKFMIILLTRNPAAHFSPDLCSRVTVVNFTVTPASLESQVLSEILKTERPDVDKRRTDVLRLQGEQNAKLRELQDILLDRISAVQGAILDDDSVINTLESIKSDAAKLHAEVGRTAETLDEVRAISNTYLPLAQAVSNIFFTLESLAEIYFLYQYTLHYFLDIVHSVLLSMKPKEEEFKVSSNVAVQARIELVKGAFLKELSRRVLPSLRDEDKLVFLVRLAQISSSNQPDRMLSDAEADFLTKGAMHLEASSSLLQKFKSAFPGEFCSDLLAKNLVALSLLPSFAELHSSITDHAAVWRAFMESTEPETCVPLDYLGKDISKQSPERKALLKAVLIRAIRPERVLFALEDYITVVFSSYGYEWRELCAVDLKRFVEKDSAPSVPLMLCSQVGQDASGKIDALSEAMQTRLLQVSMGSSEGFTEADKLIAQASKLGCWVLLRNVHLCPDWLGLLEKRLHNMSAHNNFRLFMTCEISDLLPTSLLRMSEVLVFESSSGMKASLQRFFASLSPQRIEKQPVERARLYGLFAWFNAVVQERLRYAPLGWTKRYEFNDADVQCSVDVIDEWVDEVAGGRGHVDPQQLPWQALQVLISESLYGGRVDQPFDQAALESFVQDIFNARNYSAGAVLARDTQGNALVTLPDSLGRQALETWTKSLPDSNSPAWIGLPSTAETQLKRTVAQRALANLAVLEGLLTIEDMDGASTPSDNSFLHKGQQAILVEAFSRWINLLPDPTQLQDIVTAAGTGTSVLARTLLRELLFGAKVVAMVKTDLVTVQAYVAGGSKLTNGVRDILSCYRTATLPKHWKSLYPMCETGLTMNVWLDDLVMRVQQLLSYGPALSSKESIVSFVDARSSYCFCLGRMFSPEAFIAACRQETAQKLRCSLEELELWFSLDNNSHGSDDASLEFSIESLVVQGAQFDANALGLQFSEDLRHNLQKCKLSWRPQKSLASTTATEVFPVYLNESRKQLICQALLPVAAGLTKNQWAQRSVALLLQTSHV
eukprot:gene2781-3035_t